MGTQLLSKITRNNLVQDVFFLMTVPRLYFCFWIFFICVCLCNIVVSLHCLCLAALRSPADLLALLVVMFYCVLSTFPYGVLVQVWYLIVSVPDLCLLPYLAEIIRYVSPVCSDLVSVSDLCLLSYFAEIFNLYLMCVLILWFRCWTTDMLCNVIMHSWHHLWRQKCKQFGTV